MKYELEELRIAIGGRWLGKIADRSATFGGVSNDTRRLAPGDLYVALRGANFDGHNFLNSAKEAGALCAIVAADAILPIELPLPCIVVRDTLKAFGMVARMHRIRQSPLDLIAIAGSNGKTTTRAMIATIMGAKGQVLQNEANHNNQVGVPQTLLRLTGADRYAVVEIGTSLPGEIEALTQITRPNVGVLTNISEEHLTELGGIEGVAHEEAALLRGMRREGVVVINNDDQYSIRVKEQAKCRVVSCGIENHADISASDIKLTSSGTWFRLNGRHTFKLKFLGRHFVSNALSAIAVGWVHGVTIQEMQKALAELEPVSGRMCLRSLKGVTVIDDSYNANPASMRAAMKTVNDLDASRYRIVCLGDMLDLGEHAEAAHRKLAWYVRNQQFDLLVAVGPLMHTLARTLEGIDIPVWYCESPEDAGRRLAQELEPEDILLVKGSRGMRMERVVEILEEAEVLPAQT